MPAHLTPLYMLAFDHRQVLRDAVGRPGEDPAVQRERLSDGKQLVYEGLLRAVDEGLPREHTGILIDEEYGAPQARAAKAAGLHLAMPVEASRSRILEFQYGDEFAQHIEDFDPDIVKVLVFHNPADADDRIATQVELLRTVSRWARKNDKPFMLELLIRPHEDQLAEAGGSQERFHAEQHTELLRRSIEYLQKEDVEPDLWKVEALPSVEDYRLIAAQSRAGGREHVDCIVLGNGADLESVRRWLATARAVDGFSGFAVGRSVWLESLRDFYAGEATRDEAVSRVATAFTLLVHAFNGAA